MKNNFKTICEELESKIKEIYDSGISLEDAERLSAKFIHGMMLVSEELKAASLDARMRKSGMKALRAALYLSEVQKGDKKPTEAMLTAILDSNEVIQHEQQLLDEAEVNKEDLERKYDISLNGHIYTRGVAKGRME